MRTTGVLPMVPRMLSWIMRFPSKRVRSSGSSARSVGYASFMRMHVSAVLLALLLQVPATARMTARRRPNPGRCGWTTSTRATPTPKCSASTASCSSRCPGRATPRSRSTTRTSASTSSRSSTARRTASSIPAGSRRSSASGRRPARRRRSAARSPSRCASRRPRLPVQISLKKRDAENAFREVWTLARRSRRTSSSTRPLRPRPVRLIQIQKNGEPGAEGRLPDPGRRLHGRGARASSRRTRGAWRIFSSPSSRSRARRVGLQRLGHLPSVRGVGDFAALGRASIAARGSAPRYDAFGSERYILTFDNRSFRDVASFAPYEFVEILTNTRTYGGGGIFGQYSHRGGRQPLGAVRLRPRVRPPLRRPRRRVLHLARVLRAGAARAHRAVGSRTSRRCSIRRTSSGRIS